jgi:hypothetical protein
MRHLVKIEVDWSEFIEMVVNADLARTESHKLSPNRQPFERTSDVA